VTLRADLTVRRGQFHLAAAFGVPAGRALALLGPNGAGKSTVLSCLAGLLRPERGSIELAGRALDDVPAHERKVGLLAQDPLLFPHLTVADNVAFAPRSRGMRRAEARALAMRWLREVDAADLAERKPRSLSGGQAQRVAVARALAGSPRLLLLDEPLAALDVDAAPAIRGLLRRILRSPGNQLATVLVTHDPLDALALADEVAVLAEGRIVERGRTRDVLAAPRTAFTARIAGLNLVPGIAVNAGLRTAEGETVSGILAPDAVPGEPAVAVFAPASVAVYRPDSVSAGSPRNTGEAVVDGLEPQGTVVRLHTAAGNGWTTGLTADLTPAAVAELEIEPGSLVRLSVKAAMITVHPASSE
jgi:molybdate transport system ATP-binding protein